VLGALATKTGRLGTGIVAHATFNAVAFFSLAMIHV
jgi:membrane protease YdiL (CAAX protease family)